MAIGLVFLIAVPTGCSVWDWYFQKGLDMQMCCQLRGLCGTVLNPSVGETLVSGVPLLHTVSGPSSCERLNSRSNALGEHAGTLLESRKSLLRVITSSLPYQFLSSLPKVVMATLHVQACVWLERLPRRSWHTDHFKGGVVPFVFPLNQLRREN